MPLLGPNPNPTVVPLLGPNPNPTTYSTGTVIALLITSSIFAHITLYTTVVVGQIPLELGGLVSLRRLKISNNRLSGSLPSTIGSLTHLTLLYASVNSLNGTVLYCTVLNQLARVVVGNVH